MRARRVIGAAALLLGILHVVFHGLADGLGYGYENALGFLFGPNEAGLFLHAITETLLLVSAALLLRRNAS